MSKIDLDNIQNLERLKESLNKTINKRINEQKVNNYLVISLILKILHLKSILKLLKKIRI